MKTSKFTDLLKKRGYHVESKKLSGGFVNEVSLISATKGDELIQYVVKRYKSEKDMDSMTRGYDLVSRAVKTPAIVYMDKENREVAYDFVKAKNLKEMIAKHDPRAKEAVIKLANELQKLHDSEKDDLRFRNGDSPEEKKIRKQAIKVYSGGKIDRQDLEDVQRAFVRYVPKSGGIIHGDAHLGNFLYTKEGELYIIDPDNSKKSDPNADLGKVMESIEELRGKGQITRAEANELQTTFKGIYQGETRAGINLHQLKLPLTIAQKENSSVPRLKEIIRKLRGRNRNNSLEGLAQTAVIFVVSLALLALFGLKISGKSIFVEEASRDYTILILIAIALIGFTLFWIFKKKK